MTTSNMKSITAQTALTGGCGLWIVPEPEKSKWARKIDWYLNFQLVRAEDHDSAQGAAELKEIVQKWHVEPVHIEIDPHAPLMVASAQLLPVPKTVLIPFTGDAQAWARVCCEVRHNLQQPATRIFLPESLDADTFTRAWSQNGKSGSGTASNDSIVAPVELVADQEYAHLPSLPGLAE